MGPVESLLRDAHVLISGPGQICVKAIARDAGGNVVSPKAPEACQWCAYGALDAVTSAQQLQLRMAAYGILIETEVFGAGMTARHDAEPDKTPERYLKAINIAHERGL